MAISDQNEIKKVINIEAGNSLTLLSDYKNKIDDLKKSLEGLDETSSEYKNTTEEIEKSEKMLNSIMKLSTDQLNEANKRYEELVSLLKQTENGLNGVNKAGNSINIDEKIADFTQYMKDLTGETSNSTEGINELGDAGASTFEKLLDGTDKSLSSLGLFNGSIGQTIKSVIQCGKAALSAGKDAAAAEALASGGLTIIISALVLIIGYWDEIKKFVGDCVDVVGELFGIQNSYKIAVQESEQAIVSMNNRLDEANDKLSFQLRLMRAQGATSLEVAQAELKELRRQRDDIIDQQIAAQKRGMTDDQAKQIQDSLDAVNDRIKKAQENVWIERARQKTQEEAARKAEQERLKTHNTKISTINKDSFDKEQQQRENQVNQILDRLHKENTDEITLLTEKYNKEKKLLEDAGKDTLLLTEEFENKRLELMQKAAAKQQAEAAENLKNQNEELKKEKDQELYELQFKEFEGSSLEKEKSELDAKWEIEQQYYLQRIELQQQYLDFFVGTEEEQKRAEEELDALRQDFTNKKMKYDSDAAKNTKKLAAQEKKDKEQALTATLSTAGNVFGALADLSEENSGTQKLFAIMETTMSTLTGAINAYKSMAGIPIVGPGLGVAAAAAVTAAGIANINKIKSTTKENAGATASTATPQTPSLEMTSVTPLLNEEQDIQRMTALSEQGDSAKETQNVRVYVVDQDIRDANTRAEVVEENATF